MTAGVGWLVAQLWFWLLVAFLVGSVVAHLVIVALVPEDLGPADPAGPEAGER